MTEATASAPLILNAIAGQYRVTTGLVLKSVSDVKEEDLNRRPDNKANSLLWIIGHITESRLSLGRLCGLETEKRWGDLFNREAELDADETYPSMTEIIDVWKDISEKLSAKFVTLTDADLTKSVEQGFPQQEKTQLGALAFLSFHESYHVGQLAYIRRLLGYERLVG